MNESDTRLKLIDPAIMKSWDRNTQVFTEYFFTSGEIVVRGSMVTRKDKKKADYLLMYAPGIPIAIVEAKDTEHTVDAGLQQGMVCVQFKRKGFCRARFSYRERARSRHGRVPHSGGTLDTILKS